MIEENGGNEPKTVGLNGKKPRRKPQGRKSEYRPSMIEAVRTFLLLHREAGDREIAEFLGTSARNLYRWKEKHSEFADAIEEGKVGADTHVAAALYKSATGHYVEEEQAIKVARTEYTETGKLSERREEVEIVTVTKYIPPNITAQQFWLANRHGEHWVRGQTVKKIEQRVADEAKSEIMKPENSPWKAIAQRFERAIDEEKQHGVIEDGTVKEEQSKESSGSGADPRRPPSPPE